MIIKNGLVFNKNGEFKKNTLYIEGESIVKIAEGEVIDAADMYVIPGLTDIHFHGCAGYDFCDGTEEALQAIADYELENGITAICPASMTLAEDKLLEVFANASRYKSSSGAELAGINMEGPFISASKKGAQNSEYIQLPSLETFMRFQKQSGNLIKIVDIAPELEGAEEFIREVSRQTVVSLAHTAADYDTAAKAFKEGAGHVTHLYNAMNPFNHREPGVIGAALDNEKVYVEMILDGVHIHSSVVRAAFKMFGDERIIMISDSMMAAGLDDGAYTLGGQAVTVKGNRAVLAKDGSIAGSVSNLMACVRTAVKEMGIPLESAVKCAAVNPAKAIGIFSSHGSLDIGKKADVVMLDRGLNIKCIIKSGKIIKNFFKQN